MRITLILALMTLALTSITAPATASPTQDALIARIQTLTPAQQEALLLLIAPTTTNSHAEEAVQKALGSFAEAMESGEIESIMAVHSNEFDHPELGGFDELEAYLSNAIDMGYLEDVEVTTDEAELEFDGKDTVTVYPITMESPFGAVILELTLSNEKGTWKISSSEASGL